VSPPVIRAEPRGAFDDVAVKDPSIVYYRGKYHVFYTSKASRDATGSLKFFDKTRAGLGYVSAPTLAQLNGAPRQYLNDLFGEIVEAPQVFYYTPQKLWYLIAQIPAQGQRPNLRPVYSTNPDIENVHGWSKMMPIRTNKANDDFWIDFWVICDGHNAHLFYTDHRGSLFQLSTPREKFPDFGDSVDETVLTERGEDARGPWRLHEASHIYYVKSARKYLALLEAVRPHPTKPNYWDSRNRFMFAMIADKLEGPWVRAEAAPNSFAGDPARLFLASGERAKYDQVSHFEIVRSGIDERYELPDYKFVLLFQGFDAKRTPATFNYDDLPWELALMRNFDGPWEQRLPGPSGFPQNP